MEIVIVDNDIALLRSLQLQLESAGHRVVSFSDPRRALFHFVRGNGADVLLLDYSMPEMNGDELADLLKSELPPECRIIMMSAHCDLSCRVDAKGLGIDTLLQKPVDRSTLMHAIHKPETYPHKEV